MVLAGEASILLTASHTCMLEDGGNGAVSRDRQLVASGHDRKQMTEISKTHVSDTEEILLPIPWRSGMFQIKEERTGRLVGLRCAS